MCVTETTAAIPGVAGLQLADEHLANVVATTTRGTTGDVAETGNTEVLSTTVRQPVQAVASVVSNANPIKVPGVADGYFADTESTETSSARSSNEDHDKDTISGLGDGQTSWQTSRAHSECDSLWESITSNGSLRQHNLCPARCSGSDAETADNAVEAASQNLSDSQAAENGLLETYTGNGSEGFGVRIMESPARFNQVSKAISPDHYSADSKPEAQCTSVFELGRNGLGSSQNIEDGVSRRSASTDRAKSTVKAAPDSCNSLAEQKEPEAGREGSTKEDQGHDIAMMKNPDFPPGECITSQEVEVSLGSPHADIRTSMASPNNILEKVKKSFEPEADHTTVPASRSDQTNQAEYFGYYFLQTKLDAHQPGLQCSYGTYGAWEVPYHSWQPESYEFYDQMKLASNARSASVRCSPHKNKKRKGKQVNQYYEPDAQRQSNTLSHLDAQTREHLARLEYSYQLENFQSQKREWYIQFQEQLQRKSRLPAPNEPSKDDERPGLSKQSKLKSSKKAKAGRKGHPKKTSSGESERSAEQIVSETHRSKSAKNKVGIVEGK